MPSKIRPLALARVAALLVALFPVASCGGVSESTCARLRPLCAYPRDARVEFIGGWTTAGPEVSQLYFDGCAVWVPEGRPQRIELGCSVWWETEDLTRVGWIGLPAFYTSDGLVFGDCHTAFGLRFTSHDEVEVTYSARTFHRSDFVPDFAHLNRGWVVGEVMWDPADRSR